MITLLQICFWLCIAIISYSYGGYLLTLLVATRFFKQKRETPDVPFSNPLVAFVVPAYNEELIINQKILNILGLDYPAEQLHIYIGSDQSTDATNAIVSGFNNPRVHLWVAPTRSGKTGIVNRLTPQIKADILVFTDANTMHRPQSLATLVRNFDDPHVGGVAGNIEHATDADGETEEVLYRSFEARQKYLESQLDSSISAFGGFYAIRSTLFKTIPANSYSNDDVLIPMNIIRQGFRMVFDPNALSYEEMTGKLTSEFSRRVRIGAGNFQAFFWLLDFLNPLKGWSWFCYVSHKVTRWFSPFFILGAFAACTVLGFLPQTRHFYFAAFFLFSMGFVAGISYLIVPAKQTRSLFYFLSMNAALFLGFFRYLRGIKSAVWAPSERSQKS